MFNKLCCMTLGERGSHGTEETHMRRVSRIRRPRGRWHPTDLKGVRTRPPQPGAASGASMTITISSLAGRILGLHSDAQFLDKCWMDVIEGGWHIGYSYMTRTLRQELWSEELGELRMEGVQHCILPTHNPSPHPFH